MGLDEERLARACYALALFTEVFRAGPLPGSRLLMLRPTAGLDDLLGLARDEEVADLLALTGAARRVLLPALAARGGPLHLVSGVIAGEAGRQVRPVYAKVAEYQNRGAIHLHVIIRLDGPNPHTPPPAWATVELLAAALRETAAKVALPDPLGGPPMRWGDQLDLRPIHLGVGEGSEREVAGYLAKYAIKATEGLGGGLDRPIGSLAQLQRLALPEHVARLVRACWVLGRQPAGTALGLRRWAHMLGYGGHCLTKSRHYATTFRALRAARRAWTARRRHGPAVALDRDGRLLPPAGMVNLAGWEYAGCGYKTPADAWLAWSMAADHHQARQLAREELSSVA